MEIGLGCGHSCDQKEPDDPDSCGSRVMFSLERATGDSELAAGRLTVGSMDVLVSHFMNDSSRPRTVVKRFASDAVAAEGEND